MPRLFIGLGSNLGDRLAHLRAGVEGLRRLDAIAVRRLSPVYETDPVGKTDQGPFLNAVAECWSDCDARTIITLLKKIEREAGRTDRGRWEPRELDLDILFYGDAVLTRSEVRIPHPEIPHRRFVLRPLADIAPLFPDPLRGKRIDQLLAVCAGTEQVKRILDML